ncbi:MAG: PAS domain S-box protein [Chloroflexota bacterium]
MSKPLHVLIAEDSEDDALLLLRELRRSGYEIDYERVDTAPAMKNALDTHTWDIVISDYAMPQFSAPQALALVNERGLDLPFLIVSGTIGEENAVAALLAGARDFISKDNMARLIPAIERELREAAIRREKRSSESALQESERRYRLLFDSNPLPLWVYDRETLAFLTVNDAAVYHYGYSRDEFLSMTIKDIRPPEDVEALLTDLVKSGTTISDIGVWQHRKKDGALIDVEITGHDLQFGSRPARLILAHDITARKQAEENLRRYNQRLETLHQVDQAILSTQVLGDICQFALEYIISQMPLWGASVATIDLDNQEGTILASYVQDGTPWPRGSRITLDVFSEADQQLLEAGQIHYIGDVREQAMPSAEILRLQAMGMRSYVTIPLIAQGKLIGALSLGANQPRAFAPEHFVMPSEVADQLAIAIQQSHFREKIQRHAAELEQHVLERTSELQHTKDRVETILNNSSDAIILSSFDGVIQQINPAFNELFGYSSDEIIGQSLLALVEVHNVDVLLNALAAVVNTGKPNRVEINASHHDGTQFDVDMVLAPIFQEGRIHDVVCGLRDITERKQMEQGLRSALEEERELSELKSRFSSMVSHEFRTPLAIILSSVGLLQRYNNRMEDEKRLEHLQQIQTQVGHLAGLLDDVLTLSRAEALGISITGETVDLTVFCKEIVGEIQQTTQKHQIQYIVAGKNRPVVIDIKLLRQAITNLLSNAVKYSPQGGLVTLTLTYETNHVVILCKDEGIGIPEADQKRLFEVFHRARNVGNIPGTGLGLPIVKRAIEVHGGTITVESAVGTGTTLIIQIPYN